MKLNKQLAEARTMNNHQTRNFLATGKIPLSKNNPTPALLSILLLCLLIIQPQSAVAGYVSAPNYVNQNVFGSYNETVVDLSVKVLGGQLKVTRSWALDYRLPRRPWRWQINRRWQPLQVQVGVTGIGGGLSTVVSRNGIRYNQVSNDLFVNIKDKRQTVTRIGTTGWRWQDRKGNWANYNTDKNLTATGNRNNVAFTLLYNATNQIIGVQDTRGVQVLWMAYNTDGRVSRVWDATNREVRYQYTLQAGLRPVSLLTQVTDVLGNVSSYTYDNISNLETKTDARGRITTLEYFGRRVIGITTPEPLTTTYQYEYDKNTGQFYKQEKTPAGKVTETWYNKKGRFIRRDINGVTQSTRSEDTASRVIVDTDALGQRTTRIRDEFNNTTKMTYPDNSTETWTYAATNSSILSHTNENGVTNKYDYDANGNLIKITEALATPVQRITDLTYDSYGNLTSRTQQGDANTQTATTRYTYDNFGNPNQVTDAEGNVTSYTHNIMGKILTKTDARGNVWTSTYDNKGNLLTQADPLNNTTTYTYDKVGNKLTETDAENNTTTYTYDANDRLTTITDALGGVTQFDEDKINHTRTVIDAEGKTNTSQTDLNDRLIKLTDGNGNVIAFEYDAIGQRTKSILPTYVEVTQYDNRGRTIKITITHSTGAGTETLRANTIYDRVGNPLNTTDAAGRITSNVYDALNHLTKTTDPAGGVTNYDYDRRDNQISVTDAMGNTHKFEYDRNNQKTKEISPMGQAIIYTYDPNSNQIRQVDAKGQRITYAYDRANRTIQQDHYPTTSATTSTNTITYSYNKNNLLIGNTTTSNGVNTSITYDALNRKTGETVSYGPFTKSYSYTYYKNGSKQSFTSPDNTTFSYTYDNDNLLSSVAIPGEGAITINSRNWVVPTKMTLPGGSIKQWTYDGLLRPKKITTNDPANNPLMNYQYTYDNAGNITQKQTEHGTYLYQYDILNRLTSANNPNNQALTDETYTYDKVGNRLSSTTIPSWSYNANNQLTGYGTTTFDYDANGNTITKKENNIITEQYTYDLNNRLSEVKNNAGVTIATYGYDPKNRRIEKIANGQTTYYIYGDEGLIAEIDDTGNIIQQYGYQPNSTWSTDPLFTKDSNNNYHYYQTDHLGTPQKLINKTGATTWAAQYQAFGEANIITQTTTNNLRFPGQYNDSETNLHYNYFRYYDPSTGRYITSDPIGLDGGPNMYRYAETNPVRKSDPDGLKTCGSGVLEPLVPDNPEGFPFSSCCVDHDDCYDDCKGLPTKFQCDFSFYNCMTGKCNKYTGAARARCRELAQQYAGGAADFGQSAFDDARKKCEDCNK